MKDLFNKRLFITLLLGFSSGLPLAMVGGTLQAWFATSNTDITTIGLLALVGQPYAYKFLWAPFIDRYLPPFLGRRRGWIMLSQIGLIAAITMMAMLDPKQQTMLLACTALVVAFLSASQDICVDAYRAELLLPKERGIGAAMAITGYRIAMIVSGGLALIMADQIGWRETYLIMGGLLIIGMVASYFGPEPENGTHAPTSLKQAIIEPFREFISRKYAVVMLLFILLYKITEAFGGTWGPLTTAFLIQGLGFSLTTVGVINKGVGLVAALLGTFVGGFILLRISLYRALFLFGMLQGIANAGFLLLAITGKNYSLLSGVVFLDNLCAGMGSTAIVALLMNLCDIRYTATQFALLSSLAGLARVVLGPIGGLVVHYFSWVDYYILSVISVLPALSLLWLLNQTKHWRLQIQPTQG